MDSESPLQVSEPPAPSPVTADPMMLPSQPAAAPPEPAAVPAERNQAAPPKPVTPKSPSHSVGTAIFATVVIVLGLAALAVYAYLKTR